MNNSDNRVSIKLPDETTVVDLGNGVQGKSLNSVIVVFALGVTHAMIAEAMIAAGRTDLIVLLDHENEDGDGVTFSPATGEAFVIAPAVIDESLVIIETGETEEEKQARIDAEFAAIRKENAEKEAAEAAARAEVERVEKEAAERAEKEAIEASEIIAAEEAAVKKASEDAAKEAEAERKVKELELRAELKGKTVVELKEMCKTLDIKVPRNAREDAIIDLIVASRG